MSKPSPVPARGTSQPKTPTKLTRKPQAALGKTGQIGKPSTPVPSKAEQPESAQKVHSEEADSPSDEEPYQKPSAYLEESDDGLLHGNLLGKAGSLTEAAPEPIDDDDDVDVEATAADAFESAAIESSDGPLSKVSRVGDSADDARDLSVTKNELPKVTFSRPSDRKPRKLGRAVRYTSARPGKGDEDQGDILKSGIVENERPIQAQESAEDIHQRSDAAAGDNEAEAEYHVPERISKINQLVDSVIDTSGRVLRSRAIQEDLNEAALAVDDALLRLKLWRRDMDLYTVRGDRDFDSYASLMDSSTLELAEQCIEYIKQMLADDDGGLSEADQLSVQWAAKLFEGIVRSISRSSRTYQVLAGKDSQVCALRQDLKAHEEAYIMGLEDQIPGIEALEGEISIEDLEMKVLDAVGSIHDVDTADLEGLHPEIDGYVYDAEGNHVARLVEGNAEDLVGYPINRDGEILDEDGDLVGRVELIQEEDRLQQDEARRQDDEVEKGVDRTAIRNEETRSTAHNEPADAREALTIQLEAAINRVIASSIDSWEEGALEGSKLSLGSDGRRTNLKEQSREPVDPLEPLTLLADGSVRNASGQIVGTLARA